MTKKEEKQPNLNINFKGLKTLLSYEDFCDFWGTPKLLDIPKRTGWYRTSPMPVNETPSCIMDQNQFGGISGYPNSMEKNTESNIGLLSQIVGELDPVYYDYDKDKFSLDILKDVLRGYSELKEKSTEKENTEKQKKEFYNLKLLKKLFDGLSKDNSEHENAVYQTTEACQQEEI